jgi:hypothetical protein
MLEYGFRSGFNRRDIFGCGWNRVSHGRLVFNGCGGNGLAKFGRQFRFIEFEFNENLTHRFRHNFEFPNRRNVDCECLSILDTEHKLLWVG